MFLYRRFAKKTPQRTLGAKTLLTCFSKAGQQRSIKQSYAGKYQRLFSEEDLSVWSEVRRLAMRREQVCNSCSTQSPVQRVAPQRAFSRQIKSGLTLRAEKKNTLKSYFIMRGLYCFLANNITNLPATSLETL